CLLIYYSLLLGRSASATSPVKNYTVEKLPRKLSAGITALHGFSDQVQEPAPPAVTSHLDHWQAPVR
ncbi:unnamed protein product, partial [Choristocarpus tenellus]